MELTKGANMALPGGAASVRVAWSQLAAAVEDVDVSVFVLNENGRVSGDADMVFYGSRSSPDGAVRIEALSENGETRIAVDPAKFRAGVKRAAITATLTSKGLRPFSDVGALKVSLLSGGSEVGTFTLDTASASEAALILGEIYERNGAWKFRAVGQGFNGGLKPLAEHYGVDIADPEPAAPPPKPTAVPSTTAAAGAGAGAAPPKPAAAGSTVNLSKISLTKSNPTVNLSKKSGALGEIRINLNWTQAQGEKRGLFGFKKAGGIDLDLCCLYELANGDRFGVQALGNNFGNYRDAPWIQLSGDDRSGAVADGEWLRVNGDRWDGIRRVLVYAMIYEGVPNWSATDGVVRVFAPNQPEIEVRLEGSSNERLCAIVMLENVGGDLKLSREVRYFKNAPDMDRAYSFNLQWAAGRK